MLKLSCLHPWLTRLAHARRRLANFICPQLCLICHTFCHLSLPVCQTCLAELPWLTRACRQCGHPLASEHDNIHFCGHCITHRQPELTFMGLFVYQTPISQLLYQLKFNRRLIVAHLLGKLFAYHLARYYASTTDYPQMIIPIPLHPKRIAQRGYNQALEIARPISRHLHIPIHYRHCQRLKHTLAQATLPAPLRGQNINDAFQVKPVATDHIAVIDDIYTTGLTSLTFIKALSLKPTTKIDLWIVARALKNTP